MAKTEKDEKKDENKVVAVSVLSVAGEEKSGIDITNPLVLDQLYATIPEASRTVDFRAGLVCANGFEIQPFDDSTEAKEFAQICLQIINNSNSSMFFEQLHKNTDLYGDGYFELVANQLGQVVKLSHIHSYRFGYETEKVEDPENPGQQINIIKVDTKTQEPVGFATFKLDPATREEVVDKKIELSKVGHLKFKVIGDNFYGISIMQPMIGSITRKVRLEDYADKAAKLIAVPKLVLRGDYENDEDMRQDAKEAASLDVNDVVILSGDNAEAKFVQPGSTNIPALREMFIVNITTASGIPRPALTSESAQINKATMTELMKNVRNIIKSNQQAISSLFQNTIFKRIATSFSNTKYMAKIPYLIFNKDNDSLIEETDVLKKKADALTSLTNSYQILISAMNAKLSGSTVVPEEKEPAENGNVSPKELSMELAKKEVKEDDNNSNDFLIMSVNELEKQIYTQIKNLNTNNDTTPSQIEDYKLVEAKEMSKEANNTRFVSSKQKSIELSLLSNYYTSFSNNLKDDTKEEIELKHKQLHKAFDAYKLGSTVIDNVTDDIITMDKFVVYHNILKNKAKKMDIELENTKSIYDNILNKL